MFADLDYSKKNKKLLQEIQNLINSAENPGEEDNFAIKKSVLHGRIDVVKFLLKDRRVNISADDDYLIKRIGRSGDIEMAEIFLKTGKIKELGLVYMAHFAGEANHTKFLKKVVKNDDVLNGIIKYDTQIDSLAVKIAKERKDYQDKLKKIGKFSRLLRIEE